MNELTTLRFIFHLTLFIYITVGTAVNELIDRRNITIKSSRYLLGKLLVLIIFTGIAYLNLYWAYKLIY